VKIREIREIRTSILSQNHKKGTKMIKNRRLSDIPFQGFALLTALSVCAAVAFQNILLVLMPAACIIAYWTIVDFKSVYYLLWCCIPFSLEIELPGGFATNLPNEPLIVGFLLVSILLFAANARKVLQSRFFKHPITALLALHVGWMFICVLHSESTVISVKFFLAKLWYVATFYFMAGWILKQKVDLMKLAWSVFIPLSLAVLLTLVRHAPSGFDFEESNYIMQPYFRNHVDYACLLALFMPFLFWMRQEARVGSTRKHFLSLFILIFLIAIQFAYTRTAYVAIVVAIGYYWIVQYKLTKYVVLVGIIGLISLISFLQTKNKYLDFAPNYEHAVSHTRFENLVEATYKLEDVSTMERVYRWVAGSFMVKKHAYFGFGAGNFYSFYKQFAVTRFRTYVSDNTEKSGIHCYYLMTTVENGIFGGIIFLGLCFFGLLKGEDIYHQSNDLNHKRMAMTVLLSFVIILMLIIINDLIESDKIGPFFFMNLAVLVNLDKANDTMNT
jgi:O-antigen ligase